MKYCLTVGARSSKLSQTQVSEVLHALKIFHPEIEFETTFTWIETTGDKDQKTSLKTLGQTDFFTKEVDERQLQGHFRVSIHSAKDLPSPLPKGLKIVALTKCIDPRDALVLREGDTIDCLPKGAKIATSSSRREEAILQLRRDVSICEIRGTIEKRLEALHSKQVDGIIIAEAALIRLQLTHLNRVLLKGPTAEFQGQLAIIAKDDDDEMNALFSCLDTREKKTLYLGLESPDSSFLHCPIIQTYPLKISATDFEAVRQATHIIITSKMCARYFMQAVETLHIEKKLILNKKFLSIGSSTTKTLEIFGCTDIQQATDESAEGICELLRTLPRDDCFIFWPHSKKSRALIGNFLQQQGFLYAECILYDTIAKKPEQLPNFSEIGTLFFSSPSCVDAYKELFGQLPKDKILKAQGKITESYLQKLFSS